MLQLRKAPYRGYDVSNDGIVDYVITEDGRCIFSGITPEAISTIQVAENVIQSIARREGREIEELRFFDLQTCRSSGRNPGQFTFDELEFTKRPFHVEGWKAIDITPEIFRLFICHIEPSAN
jgi:hypothetical protein